MKKFKSLSFIISFLIIIQFSCSKNIVEQTENLPVLKQTNIDPDAGSWKTVLLSRPDTFAVAIPAATNAPLYIGELNEIKGLQQNMTEGQKAMVKYWSAGAVLRWNEIMRGLVAEHNLPPYQAEDGTYPIPNAANPFNYPEFPFSNPPYDALVAAWHYKKLYNRVAPYKADSMVLSKLMVPQSDLPSYPSEDAVVAGVTAEMMKLLFPTEI